MVGFGGLLGENVYGTIFIPPQQVGVSSKIGEPTHINPLTMKHLGHCHDPALRFVTTFPPNN